MTLREAQCRLQCLVRLIAMLIVAFVLVACDGIPSNGASDAGSDEADPMAAVQAEENDGAPAALATSHAPSSTQAAQESASADSPDRAALVALYNATDGPNWRDNGNWLSDLPLQHWRGVWTLGGERVTHLILPRNQLRGEIPSELSNLTNLEELSLAGNELSGGIPPELGNLEQLRLLDLSENQLSGEAPSDLGKLDRLIRLNLWNNRLTGEIPPELGNLESLAKLSLAENQLTGEIPPELARLEDLGYLDLEHNLLTGEIPPELGNLKELRLLWLSGNQLSGEIPSELSSRSYLDLGDSDSTRCIPQGLRNARSDSPPPDPNLEVLDRTSNTTTLRFYDSGADSPSHDSTRIQQPITYEAYRSDSGESREYELVQSAISTDEYEDQDLNPDTVYYYYAKACNGCGCSQFGRDAVGVTTEADGPVNVPATPTGFAGRKIEVTGPDDAQVTWLSSPGATFYQVFQRSAGDGWELDAEVSAPATTYRDYSPNTFLRGFDDTSYKVRACNKAGCSQFTATVTIR